ncbi:glycosyl hydrolase [Blautia schinkii]|nr:glycosyl hydrolase [Blautia schinkii]
MEKMKELFFNPGAEYRTAPLWVWNADMTDEEIEKMLTELKTHGFGGAFVHPRPGMKVSYLDQPFFSAWKKALDTAKKLGLKLNIYDENSYPSGFGGGHVSSELPDCLSESVRYEVIPEEEMDFTDAKSDWLGDNTLIAVYACDKNEGKMVFKKDVSELPRSMWKGAGKYFAVMTHLSSQTAGWLAGFADIDRLRPEVTEKFLEKVYDPYAGHFQEDFGDTIQAIFTDEPSLPGSTVYGRGGEGTLPVNHWFAYEFQKKKGYDILKYLPALFEDWADFDNEKIRHDYYEVTQELWTDNFVIPIHKWCKEHEIAFTGHFMEDGWPKPYYVVVSPSVMSNYEYQDWPGIDLLQTGRLLNQPSEVQEISMLELMSAAHQFGKERVFCEAYGAGGYDSGLEDYKRMGDYLFVNGVNFINEHLSYTSYTGARKRDHPQSFDWRQAWWEDYTGLNDYLGRLSAVLSQGVSQERVLVMNPTMTGYISPRNEDTSQLVDNILAREPDMRPFLAMIQDLRRMQWDINLGDEVILKRHGRAVEGELEIKCQKYQIVILHECIKNMLPSTIELLKQFMLQGGKVLSVGHPGSFVSGVINEALYEELFASQNFLIFDKAEEMLAYLNENYERYFNVNQELPEGVESIRRLLEDGRELYFITNHSKKDVAAEALFHGSYLEEWNLWDGCTEVIANSDDHGNISVPLLLKDGESRLFCVCHHLDICHGSDICDDTDNGKQLSEKICVKTAPISKSPTSKHSNKTELNISRVIPEDRNIWPLQYCDLMIDGDTYKDYSVISAGARIFKKRGFPANPWDNEVQYKTRTYDRNRFYQDMSGFSAAYHFKVTEGFVPEELLLAVEYGPRYEITVNGKAADKEVKEYFLDYLVTQYDITSLVQAGENEIVLTAHKFDVELELEAVTLRGNFGVFARNGHWEMDAAPKLNTGNWLTQGYPFYCGSMVYESPVALGENPKGYLYVPHSEAPSTSVRINGNYLGVANINGVKGMDISSSLHAGENLIQIKVCASMKNYLGPHFNPEKPRRTAWPDMWKKAPVIREPSPEEYDLIPYGLNGAVMIEIEEDK